jgi:hypothetical protein
MEAFANARAFFLLQKSKKMKHCLNINGYCYYITLRTITGTKTAYYPNLKKIIFTNLLMNTITLYFFSFKII